MFSDWRQFPIVSDAVQSAGRGLTQRCGPGQDRPLAATTRLFSGTGRIHPLHIHISTRTCAINGELPQMLSSTDEAVVSDLLTGGGMTIKACLNTGRRCIALTKIRKCRLRRLWLSKTISSTGLRHTAHQITRPGYSHPRIGAMFRFFRDVTH